MTKAAFQATYSDWKLIRTRKVVQIVLEVPLEGADEAYKVLCGMPDPAAEAWVTVEMYDPRGGGATADKEPESFTDTPPEAVSPTTGGRLVQQAGMCCKDPHFQAFLRANGMPVRNTEDARVAVHFICHVTTRKDFIPGTPAGNNWDELYGKFLAWRDPEASE